MYSRLMTMPVTEKDFRTKSIYELNAEELNERLRPTADAVKREMFTKVGYFTYYDREICPDTDHMINEYQDRKELVRIDEKGNAHFIKTL